MVDSQALLKLLQLASPALPVGGFSYSEGMETLMQTGQITTAEEVCQWLQQELRYGGIQLEAAMVLRSHRAYVQQDWPSLADWNCWLSATRDSEELRQQSWQMGRALTRLGQQLHPELADPIAACGSPCNYSVAFGLIAAHWQIEMDLAVLGYLQSWLANLVGSCVKLVPLGQTTGQQILLALYPTVQQVAERCLMLADADLAISGWGLSLASMAHESLYTRLFRS